MKTKPKEELNKKALTWVAVIVGVVIVAVSVLLILST